MMTGGQRWRKPICLHYAFIPVPVVHSVHTAHSVSGALFCPMELFLACFVLNRRNIYSCAQYGAVIIITMCHVWLHCHYDHSRKETARDNHAATRMAVPYTLYSTFAMVTKNFECTVQFTDPLSTHNASIPWYIQLQVTNIARISFATLVTLPF